MRCWRCGRELIDGTSVCVYCGAAQSRPRPVTQAGRAMRSLYDRYGAQTVLTNSLCLTDGLGDLMSDSKKLCNQIRMAMDADVGRLYLEQLDHGLPDRDFYSRVKRVLTEESGMSDKAAGELMRYFDEMIGWRTVSKPAAPPHTAPQDTSRKITANDAGWSNGRPAPLDRSYKEDRHDVENESGRSATAHGSSPKKKRRWPIIAAAFLILCMFAAISSKEEQTGSPPSSNSSSGYSAVSGVPSGSEQYSSGSEMESGAGSETGIGTDSGSNQIYTDIPAVLLQVTSPGFFDPEYRPRFAFYEDGHFDMWVNLADDYVKGNSTYQVYLHDTGLRTIVCDISEFYVPDRLAQNIYLTESEGAVWIYNGDEFGFTDATSSFERADHNTISVVAIAVESPSFDAYNHMWVSQGDDDLIINWIRGGSVNFSFGLYRMFWYENQTGFCVPDGTIYSFLRGNAYDSGWFDGVVKLSFLDYGVALQVLSAGKDSGYLRDYVGQTIIYNIDQGIVQMPVIG